MKISPRSHLVMIGDSVTDCGRARPVGSGLSGGLGYGYVACVDALLRTNYPTHHVWISNMGVGGNTVRDLAARWDSDVLALKPDWLSVMIGINDVWRRFDGGRPEDNLVSAEEFEQTYDRLLAQVRPQLKGLVVMAPFYIEPSQADPMRRRMDEYGAIAKKLAAKHHAIWVDTQVAFDRELAHNYSSVFAADRVHPNHVGALVLARAFLVAVDFKWTNSDSR